jgi:hypothetical protein
MIDKLTLSDGEQNLSPWEPGGDARFQGFEG